MTATVSPDADDRDLAMRATEAWFVAHGLPYFVEATRRNVERELGRVWPVVVIAAAVCSAVGFGLAARALPDRFAWVVASQLFLLALGAFAAWRLAAGPILKWAARQTLSSLGLLVPLVTRALPMLMLFVTFLFINAEVWQVSAHLDGGVMWGTLLLFAAIAVGFLLVRLPDEVDALDDELDAPAMRGGCINTPMETVAAELAETSAESVRQAAGLDRWQQTNLVVVLLVSQLIQVLLLAMAMFGFFVVFGALVMEPEVVGSWIDQPVSPIFGQSVLSRELFQVALFLAAFSGLYFTVYAVTDATYRRQFFTAVLAELEQSVSVHAAYRLVLAAD